MNKPKYMTTLTFSLHNYIMPEPKEDPRSTNMLEFVGETYQLTGPYNPGMGGQEAEIWYVYKNKETGDKEYFKKKLGGKRKSLRNRKSNKSRKTRRKSNYRRR